MVVVKDFFAVFPVGDQHSLFFHLKCTRRSVTRLGDFFRYRVNVYLEQFFGILYFWLLSSTEKVIDFSGKNGFGHILGDFFTNSSGHPDQRRHRKNGFGHFRRFFSQTHLVTLIRRHRLWR
jgi:hypothetical protein